MTTTREASKFSLRDRLELMNKRYKRNLQRMAEEGLLPCHRGQRYLLGCSSFSISLHINSKSSVGIDISYFDSKSYHYIWGAPRPQWDQQLDAQELLTAIARAWHVIARPFLHGKSPYSEGPTEAADFSSLIAPSISFIAEGRAVSIQSVHGCYSPGSECLIAAECFMALADQLAAWLPNSEAAGQWAAIRPIADLYPWRIESTADFDSMKNADYSEEAAFYAGKFGFELSTWQQLAIAWETDPRRREEFIAFPNWGPSIPTLEELKLRLEDGAKIRQVSVEHYHQEALSSFLADCRRTYYYGQWRK